MEFYLDGAMIHSAEKQCDSTGCLFWPPMFVETNPDRRKFLVALPLAEGEYGPELFLFTRGRLDAEPVALHDAVKILRTGATCCPGSSQSYQRARPRRATSRNS